MPLYDYQCHKCDHTDTVLCRVETLCRCPECGVKEGYPGGGYERLISAPAQFNLKGSGWYKPGAS